MNHFMARLIFCFFAEDTNIFPGDRGLFTSTIEQFTESDGSNTHQVLETLFRVMDIHPDKRDHEHLPGWAVRFPYVNGGLFCDSAETPRFTRIARSYLLQAGSLDWQHINPDIFGSMIQAVADEGERGALGMHYTSVPNILKVLNPLLLDDLRAQLAAAGTNTRALRKLKDRLRRIRVFDPACGSGNFLVIAYKQMREIEAGIDHALGETPKGSVIPLSNFRGIEIRDFAVEIARLALVIAEYQSNVLYLGQEQANIVFLPLAQKNWITCGNALRLNWLRVCSPEGTGVKLVEDDLFQTPLEQAAMDFENEGGETYLCGNPPYKGATWQNESQKADLSDLFDERTGKWRSLDYVSGWFMKAADYLAASQGAAAFVSTNSICQGQQVPILWPLIKKRGAQIRFANTSFKWSNLASHKAGVTVVIVGIDRRSSGVRRLFDSEGDESVVERNVTSINSYLLSGPEIFIEQSISPPPGRPTMVRGNMPYDGGYLLLRRSEIEGLQLRADVEKRIVRRIFGSSEFVKSLHKYCLWIEDSDIGECLRAPELRSRLLGVANMRYASPDKSARQMAAYPHRMRETNTAKRQTIVVSAISSENRDVLPCGLLDPVSVVTNKMFALYDAPLWNMALIASRLHWVWIGTVCVRMRTDFSYSNTLGWNTFPVPDLTEQDKADLTHCAEDILLAREAHFPATIADLYDPEAMPDNLRAAHDRNDETLERIYIGRRFKNDTERLETLFAMYAKMTESAGAATKGADSKPRGRKKKEVQP
ncbi:class I SAM-dependent DNA methyltransferase [Granulicella cerasi]|uniref:site-specific DNA-methyltransferase (adenine-specific) n=2 Tax=Granulicella cerasi TaxID=741063 RepID=A0ABW1ZDW2_9BACT